ncbi:MAG: bifunctional folylpolyglutamate synthase/dihydrofolate synthase [Verrucomicrobia bacterium]|nr:MAG: bifunctional folylpolyglutamate synthase/dihydrofolate synthase [Verrucomicrobiota bacterium]PYJ47290.1 MAG: bifunctional folylpolyglutamate synthase/dihydrofolate synthase [Verrucomicrobiota bacterium]PYJ92135.1 MAG: bifunctional folylpolyglutamate synthase/dihydrofolate synthase [Verrucomicrobiota bacterium]
MNYREALAWLYSLQRFGIKLGLENIRRLLAELPVDLRGTRVIHVAGTNGKGSVCAMIDSICRAQGYRTALFISPHLVTFRERIRVNGEMIFEDAVANGLTLIRDLIADWDPHPTFFEVTTALALKYFAEAKLDIVILETGLGGRLDATNAVQSDVSAIAPIDFDHEKWLGDSLEKIATEKAGIIKSNIPVVCSSQQIEAEKVIRARAAECEAPLQFVTESYDCSPIALPGQHQKQNAAVAIAAIHAANIDIDDKAIARGLATVECPARFQKWDERTIIDGAHNPSAARVLAKTWREIFSDQRATLILAVLSDKNLRGICEELVPIASSVLLPKIRSERAAPPETLAKVLSSITPSLPHSIVPSLGGTLDLARAKQNPILITGSLHFAGEVLAHLHGEPAAFEECGQ